MMILRILLLCLLATPAIARGEKTGDFDYYVLALSWSPNWCEIEGDAKGSDQCDDRHDHGWVLHGLWPQYEDGWPSFCPTSERQPSRSVTNAQADVFGTAGLAWYQWKKHGVCAGVSAVDYYAKARAAYEAVNRPNVLRKLSKPIKVPAKVIEEAFLKANPDWGADMLTITCKQGHIQEARLCLTQDLDPRICGRDVRRDCSMTDALFTPIR